MINNVDGHVPALYDVFFSYFFSFGGGGVLIITEYANVSHLLL